MKKVYYKNIDARFPSDSTERLGRFAGVADNVGHALTYKLISDEQNIIFRSVIRSAENSEMVNKIVEPLDEKEHVKSKIIRDGTLPTINPEELIGKTFLMEPTADDNRMRAKIIEQIKVNGDNRTNDPRFIKFRCKLNDNDFEDIITYINIINQIKKDDKESQQ